MAYRKNNLTKFSLDAFTIAGTVNLLCLRETNDFFRPSPTPPHHLYGLKKELGVSYYFNLNFITVVQLSLVCNRDVLLFSGI